MINFQCVSAAYASCKGVNKNARIFFQALAGQNPLSIRAVTKEDLKKSIVKDEDVKDLLEGKTLKEAVGCSALWMLDYYDAYKGFQRRIDDLNTPAVLYAGRCYLFTGYSFALQGIIATCRKPILCSA